MLCRLLELGADPASACRLCSQATRPLIDAALALGLAARLANLRWHRGRRRLALWRAASDEDTEERMWLEAIGVS